MKYFVVDDNTGNIDKQVDYKTYIYYVTEFGRWRMDNAGNTHDIQNGDKLRVAQTISAYNEQGYLIAEKV